MKKSDKEDYDFDWMSYSAKKARQNKQNPRNGKQICQTAKETSSSSTTTTAICTTSLRKLASLNASEYSITTPKMLYGFLCGLAAGDFVS
jgi:hypothetical protein